MNLQVLVSQLQQMAHVTAFPPWYLPILGICSCPLFLPFSLSSPRHFQELFRSKSHLSHDFIQPEKSQCPSITAHKYIYIYITITSLPVNFHFKTVRSQRSGTVLFLWIIVVIISWCDKKPLRCIPLLSFPLKYQMDLAIFKWIEYGRSNKMSFPRLDYKRVVPPTLDTPLSHSLWGKPVPCCELPYGEVQVARLWGRAPLADSHEKLRFSIP